MKKGIFIVAVACVVLFFGYQERQDDIAPKTADDVVSQAVDDMKEQASEELKSAAAAEIGDFFRNNDLEASLGLDGGEQEKLEASIKDYIESYNMDGDKLEEAKASVEELLENAKGFSAEELQGKIAEIFEKDE